MSKLSIFLIVILSTSQMICAQVLPEATPIVTLAKDHMIWKMSLRIDEAAANDASPIKPPVNPWQPVTWDITRGGKLTRVIVTYAKGDTREYWRLPGVTICENKRHDSIDYRADGGFPAYPNACDGFYGIQNVKSSDEQGKKDFDGISYRYFCGVMPLPPGAFPGANITTASTKIRYEAWFDQKTGLPKAFKQNDETFLFEFSDMIPGDLQLPTKFQVAIQKARGL